MGGSKALELRHDGKTYRASNRDVFFRWAREHRISIDDSYRVAGTDKWIPVSANRELSLILDPENWWKVTMGTKTYVASDWDTIIRWAREGRLSTEVKIEGPKTPPGGILGKASPELSPFLREWRPEDPDMQPVRIRFDQRIYVPGSVETLREWIAQSRVPMEAEVSLSGDEWKPVTECGHFSPDLWPSEPEQESDTPKDAGNEEEPVPQEPEQPAENAPPETAPPEESAQPGENLYRITTSYGETYELTDPQEVRSLLKRKRISSFDEITHPDLPGGSMFISEFMDSRLSSGPAGILLWILTALFAAAGAAGIVLQKPDQQWMLIGGIASLVIALLLLIRTVWKK